MSNPNHSINQIFASRVWKIVSGLGLVLGIVSSVISIRSATKINQIEGLARQARDWKITIELTEPKEGLKVSSHVAKIAGKATFQATAANDQSNPSVNLILEENQVELVPFVKPLSESKWWWVQAGPVVHQDGAFDGTVFDGERDGAGIGVEFQIVILAVPKGTISEGDKLVNLPFSYAASNVVTVKRTL